MDADDSFTSGPSHGSRTEMRSEKNDRLVR
jgi:hypothetical protein